MNAELRKSGAQEFFKAFRDMQEKMVHECKAADKRLGTGEPKATVIAMQAAVDNAKWPTPENTLARMRKDFPEWCDVAQEKFPACWAVIENGGLE